MAKTIVVGDGPGGLSAALFLAKAGNEVTVYGKDETAMHYALLSNYLGITNISGSGFQTVGRGQVESFGGGIVDLRVVTVEVTDTGFTVTLEDGSTDSGAWLILTEGRSPDLAHSLGVKTDAEGTVEVDDNGRSSIDGAYVVGRSVRPKRSQAIISAGAGAAAALDILSREAGKDVQDWDSPPKEG